MTHWACGRSSFPGVQYFILRKWGLQILSYPLFLLPLCLSVRKLTCEMGRQDSYQIFVSVTCDGFSSLSQPYGEEALCHFFFPLCSSRPSRAESLGYSCERKQGIGTLWTPAQESLQPFSWQPGSKNDRRGCSRGDWWLKKVLNAVYRAALFGWGRIAAGSKFLLATSSCWQVALRLGWPCKLARRSHFRRECLLLFFTQVTADRGFVQEFETRKLSEGNEELRFNSPVRLLLLRMY